MVLHNGHGGALHLADGNDAWKSEAISQLCAMRAPPKSKDAMALRGADAQASKIKQVRPIDHAERRTSIRNNIRSKTK